MQGSQLCPEDTRFVLLMSESSSSVYTRSYATLPPGVHLVAVLNVVVGLFAMFTGGTIDFVIAGGELTLVGSVQLGTIVIGVLHLVAGAGLWNRKSWGWYLSFLVSFFGILINLSILFLDFMQIRLYFIAILIRVIILGYLLDPPVRDSLI